MKKAFTNHKSNGVYLSLPNGNGISTIWGSGSYTDNHDWEIPGDKFKTYETRIEDGANEVEVMIDCNKVVMELIDSKYQNKSAGSSVIGHLSFEEWLDILNILNRHARNESS